MNKLKNTKIGLLLKEKAPKILEIIGDVLPSNGTMGILKNIIKNNKQHTHGPTPLPPYPAESMFH